MKNRLYKISFVIGLIYQLLFVLAMFPAGFWIAYAYNLPALLPFIIGVIILGTLLLSIKRILISGAMLIIESIIMIVWWNVLEGNFHWFNTVMFLPTAIVGILFVYLWFSNKKEASLQY